MKKLFTAVIAFIFLGVAAIADVISIPPTETANGTKSFWSPHGLKIGGLQVLPVGHPNTINRGDRALIRFPLDNLIAAGKVRKAVFSFVLPFMYGPYKSRTWKLEHFLEERSGIQQSDILNTSVESLQNIKVNGKFPLRFNLDVTKAVNSDLVKGRSGIVFRFSDPEAEKQGNPKHAPYGSAIRISSIKLIITK